MNKAIKHQRYTPSRKHITAMTLPELKAQTRSIRESLDFCPNPSDYTSMLHNEWDKYAHEILVRIENKRKGA